MCEQCTGEWDFSPDIAVNTQACRKTRLLFFGRHPAFSNPSISSAEASCVFVSECMSAPDCSSWTHTMGALRILTTQTSTRVSPAGEQGSRGKAEEEEEEEEAVGSRAGAGDFSFITLPLLPSEKWQEMG